MKTEMREEKKNNNKLGKKPPVDEFKDGFSDPDSLTRAVAAANTLPTPSPSERSRTKTPKKEDEDAAQSAAAETGKKIVEIDEMFLPSALRIRGEQTGAEILKPAFRSNTDDTMKSKGKGPVTFADDVTAAVAGHAAAGPTARQHGRRHHLFDDEKEPWTRNIPQITGDPSIGGEKIDFNTHPHIPAEEPESPSFYDISTLGKRAMKRKNPFADGESSASTSTTAKKTLKSENNNNDDIAHLPTPPSSSKGKSDKTPFIIDLTTTSDDASSSATEKKLYPDSQILLSPFDSAFANPTSTATLLADLLEHPRSLNLYEASAAFAFLQKSIRSFTKTYFAYELSAHAKRAWPLHALAQEHPQFVRYTQYIADGSQYGWRKLFTESYARPHLAYALINWALKTYVLDATAFGVSQEARDQLEDQDRLHLYYDGFVRTKKRAAMLSDLLQCIGDPEVQKAEMNNAVSKLSGQITELLTPLYQSTNMAGLPSKVVREKLRQIVQLTASIALCVRLSGANGTIFRYHFPDKRTPFQVPHGVSRPQNCVNKAWVDDRDPNRNRDEHELEGFQPLVKMSCFPAVIATVPHGPDMEEMAALVEERGLDAAVRYDERTGECLNQSWVTEVRICPADVYLEWTQKLSTLEPRWKLKLSEAIESAHKQKHPSKVPGMLRAVKGIMAGGLVVATVGGLIATQVLTAGKVWDRKAEGFNRVGRVVASIEQMKAELAQSGTVKYRQLVDEWNSEGFLADREKFERYLRGGPEKGKEVITKTIYQTVDVKRRRAARNTVVQRIKGVFGWAANKTESAMREARERERQWYDEILLARPDGMP